MGVYSSDYDKEGFLKYIKKNKVNNEVIIRFEKLPDVIKRNGDEFKLQVVYTFIGVTPTGYDFEMNYYSEDLVEYLFNSKVFHDVEVGVNYLTCELIEKGFFPKEKEYKQ